MAGKQFFKYRHLDEWEMLRAMQRWRFKNRLVLGHSHEVRDWRMGSDGPKYANSGAAGRFARLIWALEIDGDRVTVIGWHAREKVHRHVFKLHEGEMSSYFMPKESGVVV
jgi:hypothetical protein